MRVRTLIGAAFGVAALAAIAWWFLWVPNWRPGLRDDEAYGIDVSAHQGPIDWRRVADDQISFAYIKATEGGDFRDDRFAENWAAADEAGITRGAYHFFTLCRDGREQALHFLAVAAPDPTALPPAVDLELAGNCGDRPPVDVVRHELQDFLTPVEAAWGRSAVLYVGDDWSDRYPQSGGPGRPQWLVSFFGRPSRSWAIWQIHGFARVDGVDGHVDLDVGRLDRL